MVKIELTQGKHALIDDDDYNRILKYKWCAHFEHNNWYAVTGKVINGKRHTIRMHRLIMDAMPGEIMDHINGNGLDNRKENLRFCTAKQNCWNSGSRKGTSSKYKGVSKRKGTRKWESYININGKRKHLGFFHTEKEAAKRYNQQAVLVYGQFARLNQV